MPIPARLVKAITFLRGDEDGLAWLSGLDDVLRHFAAVWRLSLKSVAEGGAMSCCAFCVDDAGAELVLKVPVDQAAGVGEAATLRSWEPYGVAPRVVQADSAAGIFLMERVRPGVTFTGETNLSRLGATVDLFERLAAAGRADERHDIPKLAVLIEERLTWASERFADPAVSALRPDLDRVSRVAGALQSSNSGDDVVHGDLQAKNVLIGPAGRILCIDPFTARGDQASDVAMWTVLQDTDIPISDMLAALAKATHTDLDLLEDWAYVIAAAELRPKQAARFARQHDYLEAYERIRS
jgi:streptomycin 6-kinase